MKLNDIERVLRRVVRLGKVVEINAEKCKARVEFPDSDSIVTYEMPIIQAHTEKDKFYAMPVLEEYVLCAFLPFGREVGFIIGSYYSESTPPPVTDENKFNITFADGTYLEYDKAEHKLTADVKGSCYVRTDKEIDVKTDDTLTVKAAKEIDIKTDDELKITASKDITIKTDADISVKCTNATVDASASVTVKSPSIDMGIGGAGVVTQACQCILTGLPHFDGSTTVRASK